MLVLGYCKLEMCPTVEIFCGWLVVVTEIYIWGHTTAFFYYHLVQGLGRKSWAMELTQRARLNVFSKNNFKRAPNVTFNEFQRPQQGIHT